jgi:dTDP-4-amino-4,6-dideoxygalactose transaminase
MKQNIPFFSLSRQSESIKKNILQKIDSLFESNQFIGGPYVSEFEKKFSQYIGSSDAVSCNSGTDALWLALRALEIEPNSIVLTTPFSFIASSSEIIAHRAYPIFIDIDESYNISPKKIEGWLKLNAIVRGNKALHKKTKSIISGIVVVDIFGQCADYQKIKSIAEEWNLWIIEDACQAIGAHIEEKKAGKFGDISCFSLYPTKNLGVCGDGGVITTDNQNLSEKLFKLRNHGRKSHYNYESYGLNSRLDAIQALIATEKLLLLDKWNERRREIANIYTKRLSKLPFIKTPQKFIGHHVYHQYCVRTNSSLDREIIQKRLQDFNIGTNIFYPKTLDEITFLRPPSQFRTEIPFAKKVSETIFALPIWPELTDEEVNYICHTVENIELTSQIPAPLLETQDRSS